ncbi:hypothetical protein IFM89_035048 [Coptis chinensis]|uniref:CCHC-type domain-containing protein n=1 Tax=Coptis chinensis TaxID=261450 RepID=A0A835HAV1_9MAGN|nr:hypothetical protein IFM89_035048 [Coptis chinensis]
MMTLMRKRKLKVATMKTGDVVPSVKMIYEKLKKYVQEYTWSSANENEWVVLSTNHRWIVNIPAHTCECLRRAYENGVRPLPNACDWPPPPHVCTTPLLTRPSGRPKKNRKRDVEEARTPTLFPRKKRPLKCGKCGFEGHNKQTCKGLSAAQRAQRDAENAQMETRVEPNIGRGRGGKGKKGQDNGPQSEASGSNGGPLTNETNERGPSPPVEATRASSSGPRKASKAPGTVHVGRGGLRV